jgi:hypothetical protein
MVVAWSEAALKGVMVWGVALPIPLIPYHPNFKERRGEIKNE